MYLLSCNGHVGRKHHQLKMSRIKITLCILSVKSFCLLKMKSDMVVQAANKQDCYVKYGAITPLKHHLALLFIATQGLNNNRLKAVLGHHKCLHQYQKVTDRPGHETNRCREGKGISMCWMLGFNECRSNQCITSMHLDL